MYETVITFDAARYNPSRKGKFGAFRVVECFRLFDGITIPLRPKVEIDHDYHLWDAKEQQAVRTTVLRLQTLRPYTRNCVINPVKSAMEFFARSTIYFGKAAHG